MIIVRNPQNSVGNHLGPHSIAAFDSRDSGVWASGIGGGVGLGAFLLQLLRVELAGLGAKGSGIGYKGCGFLLSARAQAQTLNPKT